MHYRGFAISVHCEPTGSEQDSYGGIAFLSCHPENADIPVSERLAMRQAITLETNARSEQEQYAGLLARAQEWVDDFYLNRSLLELNAVAAAADNAAAGRLTR
jgi:hypothetical protein